MEIILKSNKIKDIINDYYRNEWNAKFCTVDINVLPIRNKLGEIDIFHEEDVYYNISLNTKVKGKFIGKNGDYLNFEEDLNAQNVKSIIQHFFDRKFDNNLQISNMKFEYSCSENIWAPHGMHFEFLNARFDVNEKNNIKRLNK